MRRDARKDKASVHHRSNTAALKALITLANISFFFGGLGTVQLYRHNFPSEELLAIQLGYASSTAGFPS